MRSVATLTSLSSQFRRIFPRLARPKPVRTLLLLMSLAMVVPALGFTTYLVARSAAMQRAQVEQRLVQVAADLANDIDREFERMLSLLDTLALSQSLARQDFAAFHAQATSAVRRLGANILVVDSAMQQLLNTRVPYGTNLPRISDPDATDSAQQTKAPAVSNLFYGSVAQKHVFNVQMPLTADGLVTHYLILAVNAEHLLKIMDGLKLPPIWVTGVTDRRGTIVARSAGHDAFVGMPLPGFLLEASQLDTRAFSTLNVEGERSLRAISRSMVSGWLVSANVSQAVVDAEIHRSQWTLAIGGFVLVALAATLASMCAKWIIAPMEALAQSAAALDTRDIPPVLASPVLEVNEVASTLRAASIEIKARTASLRESEQRLLLAQRTARLTHVDADLTTKAVVASETFEDIFGFPMPEGDVSKMVQKFVERVHPDDRERFVAAQVEAARTVGTFVYEFRIRRPNGELRWISAHGETFGDGAGRPVRMIGTNLDITHRKEQDGHIRFLLREVSHRSKNLLAIIQAMATQTARTSRTYEAFQSRFSQRLQAMAASHDLLVNQDWEGVDIGALVRAHLRPFAEETGGRLEIGGPDLLLKPDAAQSLGLALHELATNATKYGALSIAGGTVSISWNVVREPTPARFHMIWSESRGPIVTKPGHKGFGHVVFERMIGRALKASIDIRYPPDGFVWSLDADLASVWK